jgi:hypothetical protein
LYPLIFVIPWFIYKYSWKQMITRALIIIVTFSVLLSPWWVRNYVSFGHFIPFTGSAGNPFLEGQLIFKQQPSDGFFIQYPEYNKKSILLTPNQNNFKTGIRILRYGLTHEPFKYLAWNALIKPSLLFITPFYWKDILGVSYIKMTFLHVMIFILAMVGMVISLRQKIGNKMILLFALSYFTLIYLPFITFDRYGYPNHFILIIFASFLIEHNYARRHV